MLLTRLMYSHGRLPPLQAIGRTTTFDDGDNGPYFDAVSDFETESDQSPQPALEEQKFGLPDADLAARVLQRNFRVYDPGSHVCKKSPDHASSSFIHCTNGMSIARHYAQLRHLLEEHALLDFVRDYVFRIKSLTTFVKDLENLVNNEYQTWYAIMHNCQTEAPNSKLYCLTTVCEDLRVHVNHWNCIKQRWHTDRWLKASHKKLCFELDLVRQTLLKLRDCAIWWVERLIKIGLEVFANSDSDSMSQDMLWNICRGLEEFNFIVNSVQTGVSQEGLKTLFPLSSQHNHRTSHLTAHGSNSVAQMGSCLRPIPLLRVLSIIANERAKYAALKAHRFFTTSDGFVVLTHNVRMPTYPWTFTSAKRVGAKLSNQSDSSRLETSDYCTASNGTSNSTNQTSALLRVGNVMVPDLSSAVSPLVDFAEQEQDFIGRILNVVCTSTNLLRKNGASHSRANGKSKGFRSPMRPPRGPVDESALLRTDLKRKCVSWGDSADTSARLQVASRYMETLWQSFGSHLEVTFQDSLWGLDEDYVDTELGGTTLCDDMTVMVICQLIDHSCAKELFPSGSLVSLISVRRSLHHSAALTTWQTVLWEAMGSSVSDKCYPCPLVGGEYSTKTGRLLRDAFQPLLSVLTEQSTANPILSKGAVPKPKPDLNVVVQLSSRVLVTCRLAHHWCYTKTHQFLSSWSIGSYLLVTQTDLKMLADEASNGVWLTQTALNMFIGGSGAPLENPMVQKLSVINQDLQDISGELQKLSGAAMKLLGELCNRRSALVFQDTMPPVKTWRKKSSQEPLSESSLYVDTVLETVLEPVVEGVSKLPSTSQIGVISVATVAICDAWTDFILKEKIKFSLEGASQLSVDFCSVRIWLGQCIGNIQVKQSVLELNIFRKLNGIIVLLMKQPKKKAREMCSIDDLSCENSVQTESNHGSYDNLSPPMSYSNGAVHDQSHIDQSDVSHVQNADAWLALRLHNPTRWKLSSCFAGQPSET